MLRKLQLEEHPWIVVVLFSLPATLFAPVLMLVLGQKQVTSVLLSIPITGVLSALVFASFGVGARSAHPTHRRHQELLDAVRQSWQPAVEQANYLGKGLGKFIEDISTIARNKYVIFLCLILGPWLVVALYVNAVLSTGTKDDGMLLAVMVGVAGIWDVVMVGLLIYFMSQACPKCNSWFGPQQLDREIIGEKYTQRPRPFPIFDQDSEGNVSTRYEMQWVDVIEVSYIDTKKCRECGYEYRTAGTYDRPV
ncbi:MAG: hypothetical protein SNJ75_16605 [Gemmataceae bacterium]